MKSHSILLIGGAGYIGTYLHQNLAGFGYSIETVDLKWFGSVYDVDHTMDFKDLTDSTLGNFDTVILLAGHSSVQMCQDNMVACFNNNVRNFVNLLGKLHFQKFIYASSSSVYGKVNILNASEECTSYIADNFYDLSKSQIDNYAKLNSDLEWYGLRFGTVNGFSPNLRTDIMINSMVESAVNNKKIIISNPKIGRPILGIYDLARAIIAILQNGDRQLSGIYNLCSFNSTVENIAAEVTKVYKVPVVETPNTAKTVYDFTIDSHKFESAFGFKFGETVESIATSLKKTPSFKAKRLARIPYE